jgi:hypothetical protein
LISLHMAAVTPLHCAPAGGAVTVIGPELVVVAGGCVVVVPLGVPVAVSPEP